jgi:hypothetical protein
MKKILVLVAILALAAFPVLAGEWHTGQTNLCADCHTMHNSMAHTWTGSGTVTVGSPSPDGNWVGAAGPASNYLLKAADPNALCLSCHNGTVDFAPSVLETKSANDAANRSAGFLNEGGTAAHTGHTIGADTAGVTAPGGTFVADAVLGLECINCHTQHGRAGVYRNLGPRTGPAKVPTYAMTGKLPAGIELNGGIGAPLTLADAATNNIQMSATTTDEVDVFINAPGYIPNSGNAFSALYETANVSYLKRATLVSGIENGSGTQCAYCHGSFHGAVDSANIGGETSGTTFERFNRHPVGGITLGTLGGGHSGTAASRYAAATAVSRVKVYADNQSTFVDATPGCISCHKGHGNDQPFGLIFANRTIAGMGENGNLPVPTDGVSLAVAQRGLCGQCHGQGN